MLLTLTLLAATTPTNLDLRDGDLSGWENTGFRLVSSQVTSSDRGGKGGKALMHRTFRVPEGVREIRFHAAAYRPRGAKAVDPLDIVLEAADSEVIPLSVREEAGWKKVPALQDDDDGALREYAWDVSKHLGKRVRIAIVDSDARPGHYVASTGFTFLTPDQANVSNFTDAMRRLERGKKLARVKRYDSKHFLALSNAGAEQSEYRLYNCETIYSAFYKHFRKRGFEVREPSEKLMLAIFGTQVGFEAYMGQSMPTSVTGLYHPATNRMVVYDYANNRAFADTKKKMDESAKKGSDLERETKTVTFGRWARERRDDTNLSTMMHEVAHQLAFNGGLMNREGDVPVWLAEGLATYCEPTVNGSWQGIGEANAMRAGVLVGPATGKSPFLPLRDLISNDDWIRKATTSANVVLGYSQSWALFRMLMEDRPRALKAYMKMIYARRTDDHRFADFATCFGTDLKALERKYQDYMRGLVREQVRASDQ